MPLSPRCGILLLKVLFDVGRQVPRIREIGPKVVPQLGYLRPELFAQIVQLRPNVRQTIVPQSQIKVRVGGEEHRLLQIVGTQQVVEGDQGLEGAAVVGIGQDKRLNPGKCFRGRKLS